MNRLLKGSLAVGITALAVGGLKRAVRSEPRYAPWEKPDFEDFEHCVLILGGGFAGYNAAKHLCELTWEREDVGVMVIDRHNYLTFWPLLAGVISSGVSVRNIAQPLRRPLIHMGVSFQRAWIDGIDLQSKIVTAGGKEFPYDHLVLALGAQPSYFGIPGVEEHALPMKGIPDAVNIRNRVIERLEEAALEEGEVSESKLTFVVIGAGATGVETATQLHELIHDVLGPEYPMASSNRFRIFLLDALPNILPELDPGLRRVARGRLWSQEIEVMTNALAEEVTEDKVRLKDGREIAAENVIWTAGGRPSDGIEMWDIPMVEKTMGAMVDEYFHVKDFDNVWAIGDNATIPDEDGFVPPNAQAAVKEGIHLAENILAAIDDKDQKPFQFKSQGQLVELGSRFAVNDAFGVKFSGWLAALFWRTTYLVRLDSPQNRVRQALDWALELFSRPTIAQIQSHPEHREG